MEFDPISIDCHNGIDACMSNFSAFHDNHGANSEARFTADEGWIKMILNVSKMRCGGLSSNCFSRWLLIFFYVAEPVRELYLPALKITDSTKKHLLNFVPGVAFGFSATFFFADQLEADSHEELT